MEEGGGYSCLTRELTRTFPIKNLRVEPSWGALYFPGLSCALGMVEKFLHCLRLSTQVLYELLSQCAKSLTFLTSMSLTLGPDD